MKLIDQWRAQLNRLWSVRLAILTALLAVADQLLGLFNGLIPPVWYAVLSMLVIVARVVDQAPKATNGSPKDADA